jgi:hypothetical protein
MSLTSSDIAQIVSVILLAISFGVLMWLSYRFHETIGNPKFRIIEMEGDDDKLLHRNTKYLSKSEFLKS